MPGAQRPILVTGATGRQGRATITALLERGWPVRALVRDAGSARARELASAGARVALGDFEDAGSIERALDGVHGLFLNQPLFMSPDLTPGLAADCELTRGRAVIAAAVAANVGHVVYSSAVGVDRPQVGPLLAPKAALEAELASSGLATMILRPVGFMENYSGPWRGLRPDGTIATPAPPHIGEPLVAVRDIGVFAAVAFGDPARYVGAALELAGDELTVPQIAAALSDGLGRPLRSDLDRRRSPDRPRPRREPGEDVRSAAPSHRHRRAPPPAPHLLTLAAWLESGGGGLVAAYLRTPVMG